jgi:hypothetical protein
MPESPSTIPGRDSAAVAARLANVAHESWMQDWPIEVASAERFEEFLALLEAHRADAALTFWFLDLVLESARARKDLDRFAPALLDAIVSVVGTTRAPWLMESLRYWACGDEPPEHSFEVSAIVREALLRLS